MNKYIKVLSFVIIVFFAQDTFASSFTWEQGGDLLRVGSRGEKVRDLQICLARIGNNPESNIDGVFGPITRKAVVEFQIEKNILVDGIIGDQTGPYYQKQCKITTNREIPITFSEGKVIAVYKNQSVLVDQNVLVSELLKKYPDIQFIEYVLENNQEAFLFKVKNGEEQKWIDILNKEISITSATRSEIKPDFIYGELYVKFENENIIKTEIQEILSIYDLENDWTYPFVSMGDVIKLEVPVGDEKEWVNLLDLNENINYSERIPAVYLD